jgi:hypothetical protein
LKPESEEGHVNQPRITALIKRNAELKKEIDGLRDEKRRNRDELRQLVMGQQAGPEQKTVEPVAPRRPAAKSVKPVAAKGRVTASAKRGRR